MGRTGYASKGAIVLATALLLVAFQNCSSPVSLMDGSSNTGPKNDDSGNGNGYTGMQYFLRKLAGKCADGSVYEAAMYVNGSTGRVSRKDCVDLLPADAPVVAVQPASNGLSIVFDGKTFDRKSAETCQLPSGEALQVGQTVTADSTAGTEFVCQANGSLSQAEVVGPRMDPFWSSVSLMLHSDGAATSTTVIDSSATAHSVAAVGNAQIDTAQSVFGGASVLLDGDDRLEVNGGTALAFGTGDFTIEFWVRESVTIDSSSSTCCWDLYDARPTSDAGDYPLIRLGSDNKIEYRVGTANVIQDPVALIPGVWYHIAVARSGSNTKMFKNGIQVASTWTDTTNYLNPPSRPYIGQSGFTAGSVNGFRGWIDEVRVTKGVARYASSFKPPAHPLPNQ